MDLPKINVVNKHHGHQHDGIRSFYIGRGSPLGNPYSHLPYGAAIRVESREIAIERYKAWLDEMIARRDPEVTQMLLRLATAALEQKSIDLVCFCTPKSCHGEIIKIVVLQAITKLLLKETNDDQEHP